MKRVFFMNAALIFAGGTGTRMNIKTMPKQFLPLHGKPIILYTLEQFEYHPEIDVIVVVCIESWIDRLNRMLQKGGFTKVQWVVPGGASGQESIYNGLKVLYEHCPEDTTVLVHDGVRPLVNAQVISDNIACVKAHGNAITTSAAIETIMTIDSEADNAIRQIIPRKDCAMARAPQSFYLRDLYAAHCRAISEGRLNFIDSASMMMEYGQTLYTVTGPAENIKITTPSDYYMFKSFVEAEENKQIFGY